MTQPATFNVYNASAGSGKTFTLVKEYLKILLTSESIYSFQNILAITFTNKAAAEMKERILENLRSFVNKEENGMFVMLCSETGVEKEKLYEKSKRILENILQNYSAFNITTIDSFTHKLIRTFAYDLGLPMNFEVEMDGGKLLKEAVDILISKIGIDEKLTEILIDFSIQKVNEDKSWDISKELNSIAKILLNEEDVHQLKKIESKSLDDFKKLEKKIRKYRNKIVSQFVEKGKEGLCIIDDLGVEYSDFSYSDLPNFFKKLIGFKVHIVGSIKFEGRLHTNISNEVLYTKSKKQSIKDSIDSQRTRLIVLYNEIEDLYNEKYPLYILTELVSKSLIPLAVLNNIQKELTSIKDQNNICLNAEFNQMISEKIKNEPTPFIYERIGEKFQSYFIDEMQDTSYLQWQNLIPLINNALSQEKGSLLLVGDAKQAIYRWRGGKAEQFIDLSLEDENAGTNPFLVSKGTQSLSVNYRSYSEVISFNNSFFSHISSFLTSPIYEELYVDGNRQEFNSNHGGYVQLNFIDKKGLEKEEREIAYPQKVLEIIQQLDVGFKKSNVCVLVRRKKDGVAVANYLSENNIDIISSETLLLQNSFKVQFLIHTLMIIHNPLDKDSKFKAVSFLYDFLKIKKEAHLFYESLIHLELSTFFKELEQYGICFEFEKFLQMPFYESIEELIRSFRLVTETDAYVQFFLDFVLDFQRKNYNDLSMFLELWEQKKDNLSIASVEGEDAVRIMTIHKSKGLEFPVVIFPCDVDVAFEIDPIIWYDDLDNTLFEGFSTSLVACSKKITFAGEKGGQLFEKRKEELALDNFNLLYVALTRAVEQLYVVTDFIVDKKGAEKLNFYSGLFVNYLKGLSDENKWDASKLIYEFGNKLKNSIIKEKKGTLETELQESFISTPWESHDISIVANSSKRWGTNQDSAIKYGLLIHEMLSKIITVKDVKIVVNSYLVNGIISKSDKNEIINLLMNVVAHQEIAIYFQGDGVVFNEREILKKDGKTLIPDRLMFYENEVVVVDYKTGMESCGHGKQIEEYVKVLLEMGFKVTEKIVVYIGEQVRVVAL